MTDRTAAALASALPAGISYPPDESPAGKAWSARWNGLKIAEFQAEQLALNGWRLVHADDPPQTFAEHYAAALARVIDADQVHDHVEVPE
jgi:hypothetical protein